MKKEVVAIFIVGLFILAYVMDATVPPMNMPLATPYSYFDSTLITKNAFSSTSIIIKAIGIFLSTILILSALPIHKLAKGSSVLVISGLLQLYALQDIMTNSRLLPLEWSIALTLSGVMLILPAILYLITGMLKQAHTSIVGRDEDYDDLPTSSDGQFWEKK